MSITITGLIVMVLVKVFQLTGIQVAPEALQTTVETIIYVIAGLTAYIGRVRVGDITWYGKKLR